MLTALAGCSPDDPTPPAAEAPACGVEGTADWRTPTAHPRDDELTLAHVQARGTHNSYHQEPSPVFDPSHGYTQAPLGVQLGELGVRQLELDLHRRDDGGFDVFHLPAVDAVSSCPTFLGCLTEICVWSATNPDHAPLLVWLEPKDEIDALTEGYQAFTGATGAVEDEIFVVFPRERVYTPDDWRRDLPDLGTATATLGPPTLGELRGRVLFGLLDSGTHRDDYLRESPDLAGRALFPDTDSPADSFAALVKDAGASELPALHDAGLTVTGNVDGADATDADNAASRDLALAAGLHFAASDFPAAVDGRSYWMELADAVPVACNPVTAPPDCDPTELE